MMTSSNGNIFRVTGLLCGEFTGHRWIPHTKASDASFDVIFVLRPNKQLSKQSWGLWFETRSRSYDIIVMCDFDYSILIICSLFGWLINPYLLTEA